MRGLALPRTGDGKYAGHHPADGADAVAQLEQLRGQGARYFLIPSTYSWWLSHYQELGRHLRSRYRLVADCPGTCVIYDLQAGPVATEAPPRAARSSKRPRRAIRSSPRSGRSWTACFRTRSRCSWSRTATTSSWGSAGRLSGPPVTARGTSWFRTRGALRRRCPTAPARLRPDQASARCTSSRVGRADEQVARPLRLAQPSPGPAGRRRGIRARALRGDAGLRPLRAVAARTDRQADLEDRPLPRGNPADRRRRGPQPVLLLQRVQRVRLVPGHDRKPGGHHPLLP